MKQCPTCDQNLSGSLPPLIFCAFYVSLRLSLSSNNNSLWLWIWTGLKVTDYKIKNTVMTSTMSYTPVWWKWAMYTYTCVYTIEIVQEYHQVSREPQVSSAHYTRTLSPVHTLISPYLHVHVMSYNNNCPRGSPWQSWTVKTIKVIIHLLHLIAIYVHIQYIRLYSHPKSSQQPNVLAIVYSNQRKNGSYMKITYLPQKSHRFSHGLNNQISSYCHHLIACGYKKHKHSLNCIHINDVFRWSFAHAHTQHKFMQ